MLNGTAEGGMALPGDHCLRVDSRQLFIAHPSRVNPGSSPAEKGVCPAMQEFPALTYKVKELHAAIQNRLSPFTDEEGAKKKFRPKPGRFGIKSRCSPACAKHWCESRSHMNPNSAPREPLGEPVLLGFYS
jgi:hypothetical protein